MIDYATHYFRARDATAALGGLAGAETKLPAYVEDSLLFPYEQGLEFVETFRGDSGSWGALDNVWRFRPPASEEQIIHPDKYAVDERAVRVRVPDLGLVLGGGWQRYDVSSVGELDLRELFKLVGGTPDDSAAAGWGGGRFVLWRSGSGDCAAPCVSRDLGVMSLAWDSAGDRAVAEGALADAFRKGLHARRAGRAAGAALWSSRGGTIAMARSGRGTQIVFAPSPALAGRAMKALR
jgi:hypothetical protein